MARDDRIPDQYSNYPVRMFPVDHNDLQLSCLAMVVQTTLGGLFFYAETPDSVGSTP